MSVLMVTSLGDIVIDLHTDRCPLTTKNFLKLCKMKYYNGCLFHKVEKDFTAQTGDRTGTGQGGDSLYKFLYGDQARFFDDEIHPDLKHAKRGTLAMASAGKNCNASQFYFTLRDELDYLDGKHTVFGIVEEEEGLDTLAKINEAFVDDKGRPYKNIRIKHTYILDDPFSDPPQLAEFIPEKSPEGKPDDETAEERLEDNWVPMEETLGVAELEEVIREKEAHTNAAILETIGDIPDADIKPPENVLFVCKLNPVTQDEDLHTIFSRFGNVVSADIIRDYKTGDSLCYAFIEFESQESCELAYFKMDNTLIDDRRIHVDFSQSVSKLWSQYRHGKKTQNKGGGCFKCGAPDHIAKNCGQGSEDEKEPLKYVLKEGNTQHGDANRSYDMVFEGEHLGKAHSGDEANIGRKKLKLDDQGYKEQSRRGYDQNSRDSNSRSYKYHSDDRRKVDRQDVKLTPSQRDRGRGSSDRDREKHESNRLPSDRDREKHATDRRSGESQKSEDEKKYESSRHGRVRREHRERGSTHDTHSRDEARDASIQKKESADQHIHRHHRNKENGKHSSGVDQDKFSQRHESYRPRCSESRSSDRHREDARGRRADEKNMHSSRRARDDDMYRRRHERS